jgi:hypothetical protein
MLKLRLELVQVMTIATRDHLEPMQHHNLHQLLMASPGRLRHQKERPVHCDGAGHRSSAAGPSLNHCQGQQSQSTGSNPILADAVSWIDPPANHARAKSERAHHRESMQEQNKH